MQSANAKKFRAELKDYMDVAVSEPGRINRRDGQSFVLMSEQIYEDFRNEIQSLEHALHSVEQFNIAIDRFLNTMETMYQNPQHQDHFGLKSFPIRDGRYRIFYKVQKKCPLNLEELSALYPTEKITLSYIGTGL